ncbi:MAG: RDD family protein [bacterium]|nr:RDD family protein [bacterium]
MGRFLDVLVTTFGLAMFVGMLAMMIVLILRPPDSPEMQDFSIAGNVVLSAFGIVFGAGLIYCQVHFMTESGQTLGKKVAGLKLVSVDTHLKPGVFKGYVLRELVRSPALLLLLYIPTVLPNILVFAYLIADLFSLGTDSGRCLHDRICGTLVVGVEEEHPEGTATATD